jgi:hypothetical protein
MSALSSLTTQDNIAGERDSLGGGGVFDSAIYDQNVALAYVITSQGGAQGLVVHLKNNTDGRELRQTLWMTSGTAKGGKNYYEDKNGERHYLPGFIQANGLCLLTVGKEISEMDTETKVVPLYNYEAKAEVPTKVEMLTELLGKPILTAVFKQTVNKNVKNSEGQYVPSAETRDENEIDKFFRASDRKTVAEIKAQADEGTFIDAWAQKNTGKVRDRTKAGASGVAGAPAAAGAAKRPTTSLFATA